MGRQPKASYEFGPFVLDTAGYRLLRNGQRVPLTPRVFDVLRVLVQNSGHLVEKDKLLKEVWPESFVEESNLNRSISILRRVLGEGPTEHQYIETVPKRGYRFVAGVTQCWEESAELIVQERTRSTIRMEQVEEREEQNDEAIIESLGREAVIRQTAPLRGVQRISKSLALAGLLLGTLLLFGVIFYVIKTSDRERQPSTAGTPIHKQITFTGHAGSPAISPDGRSIAYVSFQSKAGMPRYEAGMKVLVQDLAGGASIEIFTAQDWCEDPRWSPDGSELVFRSSGGIFLAPRLGGTARPIARNQFFACWSPDGSQIAVAREGTKKILFLKKVTGEERSISLEGSFRWIMDLDWSPAGNFLLFLTHDDQARSAIWTVSPDGGQQRKVIEDDLQISSARWSPSGDAIYYFRSNAQTMDLWKIPATSYPGKSKANPSVVQAGIQAGEFFSLSRDGKRLVYAREPRSSNLWLAKLSGLATNPKVETRALTTGTSQIERPSISPDGKQIAFNIGQHPNANLYTLPTEGGPPKQLTFFNSCNVGPVWSPDGKWIAFASTQDGPPRVWIVNAEGGIPRLLSSNEVSNSFYYLIASPLAWSPGSSILYQRPGNRNFSVLSPKTGEERLLVKNDAVGWMFEPVYSPDGEKVAVWWNRKPSAGIWVITPAISSEVLVYKPASKIRPVGWSTDGKWIYALEAGKIIMISPTSGQVRTLVSLPFKEIRNVSMTPDGKRFACAVSESQTDVWMIENFDASALARTETTAASPY